MLQGGRPLARLSASGSLVRATLRGRLEVVVVLRGIDGPVGDVGLCECAFAHPCIASILPPLASDPDLVVVLPPSPSATTLPAWLDSAAQWGPSTEARRRERLAVVRDVAAGAAYLGLFGLAPSAPLDQPGAVLVAPSASAGLLPRAQILAGPPMSTPPHTSHTESLREVRCVFPRHHVHAI